MPFAIGSGGAHDDTLHQGSAKRNAASGLKGIDASSNLTPKVVMADIDAAILNAANGIAGLDAGALLPVLQLPTHGSTNHDATVSTAKVTESTYTGDSSVNKAIAHGLGVVPSIVMIFLDGNGGMAKIVKGNSDELKGLGGATAYSVTAMDATNFYVGNATSYGDSVNNSGSNYTWTAIK